MNLYLVKRPNGTDYDQFYAMVCAAETSQDARDIHPQWSWDEEVDTTEWPEWTWVPRDKTHLLEVVRIGRATIGTKAGTIILADFNAG